ncbi:MAG TPA: hypothetical protein VE912_26540 [Bacteroidales bacterium]|nr:hypothetical protein [Bacteroidales bacterium]
MQPMYNSLQLAWYGEMPCEANFDPVNIITENMQQRKIKEKIFQKERLPEYVFGLFFLTMLVLLLFVFLN